MNQVKDAKERRHQLHFIRGLLGTVIYGGKLDTRVDQNILSAAIGVWFDDSQHTQTITAENETQMLGLSANVSKWKLALTDERIGRGLKVLDKATSSTAQVEY